MRGDEVTDRILNDENMRLMGCLSAHQGLYDEVVEVVQGLRADGLTEYSDRLTSALGELQARMQEFSA